jgi:hypothetical protein
MTPAITTTSTIATNGARGTLTGAGGATRNGGAAFVPVRRPGFGANAVLPAVMGMSLPYAVLPWLPAARRSPAIRPPDRGVTCCRRYGSVIVM